jgi:nitrogenase-stabilizing/protective protein
MSEILTKLHSLSAAEDFFKTLDVPFEPGVVNVSRLHILKRMGQYLAKADFSGMSEEEVTAQCKATLERAYQDFVDSNPLQERVFKVLKEAVEPKAPPAKPFVAFEELLK